MVFRGQFQEGSKEKGSLGRGRGRSNKVEAARLSGLRQEKKRAEAGLVGQRQKKKSTEVRLVVY